MKVYLFNQDFTKSKVAKFTKNLWNNLEKWEK